MLPSLYTNVCSIEARNILRISRREFKMLISRQFLLASGSCPTTSQRRFHNFFDLLECHILVSFNRHPQRIERTLINSIVNEFASVVDLQDDPSKFQCCEILYEIMQEYGAEELFLSSSSFFESVDRYWRVVLSQECSKIYF